MIREINVSEITAAIKEMCIKANHFLSPDMDKALKAATANEESPLGKKILNQLQENLKIAGEDMIPICQDTGMAVFFIEIGQDVHFTGGVLEDAINEGVRQGYTDGYLRKSVVKDPLADGIEGVKNAILTAVSDAGPNACPPMVVGVGVGGTFEKCAIMAKKALTREAGTHSDIEYVAELEKEMLEKINNLGIGPGGLGGSTTALAVNINTYPTHIAGLPVAVNICCHVNRHVVKEL